MDCRYSVPFCIRSLNVARQFITRQFWRSSQRSADLVSNLLCNRVTVHPSAPGTRFLSSITRSGGGGKRGHPRSQSGQPNVFRLSQAELCRAVAQMNRAPYQLALTNNTRPTGPQLTHSLRVADRHPTETTQTSGVVQAMNRRDPPW